MKCLILLIVLLLTGCNEGRIVESENIANNPLSMVMYPSGTTSSSYYFVYLPEKELRVQKGIRDTHDDITQSPFILKVEKDKKQKLSQSRITQIDVLIKEIFENDDMLNNEKTEYWDDGCVVQLLYDNKKIEQDYNHIKNPQIKELVDILVESSPVKVSLSQGDGSLDTLR